MAPSGGGTGTGDWKTDGQRYRRCQGLQLPVPAAVRGTAEGECGLITKHVHHQLARCNPLFHFPGMESSRTVLDLEDKNPWPWPWPRCCLALALTSNMPNLNMPNLYKVCTLTFD